MYLGLLKQNDKYRSNMRNTGNSKTNGTLKISKRDMRKHITCVSGAYTF